MKGIFNKDILFRIAIYALAAISLALAGMTYFTNRLLFMILMPVVSILIIAIIIKYHFVMLNMHRYIVRMDREINFLERESLYDLPIPALVINDERTILWYNNSCRMDVLDMLEAYGMNLDIITDISTEKLIAGGGTEVNYNERSYIIHARQTDKSITEGLTIIYFIDVTQLSALSLEHKLSKQSVMLIMIDNYEEILKNVRESEKAYVYGEIEKVFEKFMGKTTGIIRRISSDRFIAIIEERHLNELIAGRFKILDDARAVIVDNRMGATLSIGVGKGAKTLIESEQFAKQALDMALGRGGDQAAVKTANGFEFYGGISQGIEKQTKVKTRIIATALSELMEASDRVLIMGHRFGDLDSLGSAIGLVRVARNMGKEAYIAVDIAKNLATTLIKRIEDNDGGDIFLPPHAAAELVTRDTLLIIVDTHNPDFLESEHLYNICERVVVIDHHRKMVNHIDKAVIFHHEPYASSASEMVTELIQYFGDNAKLSPIEAEALLAGITLDTKNFVMKTGVRTFEAAAFLRKIGADTIAVRALFSNSIDSYQRKTRIVSSSEIYRKCAIATSDFTSEDLQIVAPQAADELLGISGVQASFVLYEADNTAHISARSMGKINVQVIMEKLGGGGHLTMAGAQLQGINIESARQSLLEVIDEYYDN